MNVEYVSCKISAICWLKENFLKQSIDSLEPFWLCGTYSSDKNSISIYSKQDSSASESAGIIQLKNLKYSVSADVISLASYDSRSSFVSLANGDILLMNYSRENGFDLHHQWSSDETRIHQSTDILVNSLSELISCGIDGRLLFFDIGSDCITKSPALTSNSLHCMDKISENEVICGTTSGQVKLFDKRSQKVEQNLVNEMSLITSIKRNNHIPHILACGSDSGLLYLWDLRNSNHPPTEPMSVHTAEINCLKYLENEPNILTSSLDGQLIKWNISNGFQVSSVEVIIDKKNTYPINCFDIFSNQVVFADDFGVLYWTNF